jgi:hypothetical protein
MFTYANSLIFGRTWFLVQSSSPSNSLSCSLRRRRCLLVYLGFVKRNLVRTYKLTPFRASANLFPEEKVRGQALQDEADRQAAKQERKRRAKKEREAREKEEARNRTGEEHQRRQSGQ